LPEYVYNFNERRSMLPFVPYGASVLEVGCGRGGFGLGLRRDRGVARSVGIEIDETAAEEARAYYDEVLCGPYPDVLAGRTDRFDCVVFNDVLEHLVDPWQALVQAKSLLAPGGMVVASIPNVRMLEVSLGLLRGDWQYQDQGVLDQTHLRFFTRRSIQQMLAQTDYELLSICPINPLPRYRRVAGFLSRGGRIRRTLADFVHIQFAVTATPRG
jgi:2-polyprenyl-3-methyl-5-hydroxy-6-metoxy-1,4-benzoquinol methylase